MTSRNSESEPVSYRNRNSSAVIPDFLSPAAVLNWANDTPTAVAAFTAAFGLSQSAAPRDFKRGDGGNGATAADDRGPGGTSAIGEAILDADPLGLERCHTWAWKNPHAGS